MFRKLCFCITTLLFLFLIGSLYSTVDASSATLSTSPLSSSYFITDLDPKDSTVTNSTYDITLLDIGNPLYPGTSTEMMPGDIIYSPKNSWDSVIVGHVAIVGDDFRIYHVTPAESDGRGNDSIGGFLSRFKTNTKLAVYRTHYTSSQSEKAAIWARRNITKVNEYFFNIRLSDVYRNYCSKFVWQAYYYGAGKDILNEGLDDSMREYILPADIRDSATTGRIVSFYPN